MSYIPKTVPTNQVLNNSGGTPLTEDETTDGMYVIAASGAGTEYFYLSETFSGEITNVRFVVDAAVTLEVNVEMELLSTDNWQSTPAYATGEYAGDGTSQELNVSYPLRDLIVSGTNLRVAATVGGACNIGVQVVTL